MKYIKIKETCLYVDDLEKTKQFYHGLLELPIINYDPGKHIFFRIGTSVLLCFNPEDSKHKVSPPGHYGGGKQHVAFEVSRTDYDKAKAEISAKGITVIDEVEWSGGIKSFYFEDPEGNILEIVPDKGIWD
jgi:catechol 2,3-dioxygenase-like lactoylglutathione lyase family enzyme